MIWHKKNGSRSLTVLPRMDNRGLLAGQTVREEVMARRVGIVGIGIMGTAMMRNLVKDGFEVSELLGDFPVCVLFGCSAK